MLTINKLFFILLIICIFLVWILSSIVVSSRRQARNAQLQEVVRGNVDDRGIFEVPIVSGRGDASHIGSVTYNFEEGVTTATCSNRCMGGDKITRFKYNFPDFDTGRHLSGIKTCFCDRDVDVDSIKYNSNDEDLDTYARSGSSKQFIAEIAKRFGFDLTSS